MPKKPPVPDTIGTNPLDQVADDQAVSAILSTGRRKAGTRPDTTVLTVTVPSDLADDLEQLIAITPGTDLDSLATEALREVLAELKRNAKTPVKTAKGKSKAKGTRAGGPTLVIVSE
jgi:hypothetical protein